MNQSFADAIQDVYKDGDLIWVHDYHLTMLPQMLRNVLPSAKIGFFLHLPFPSSEVIGMRLLRRQKMSSSFLFVGLLLVV